MSRVGKRALSGGQGQNEWEETVGVDFFPVARGGQ